MDSLSTELKQLICGHMQVVDLKSLRQASKTWAEIAATSLFNEISINTWSLEHLVNVALHELLRRCVRTLNFHSYRLPFILPEIWNKASKSRFPDMTEREHGAHYQTYVHDFHKQENHDGLYLTTAIHQSLRRLPNLQTIRSSYYSAPHLQIGRSSYSSAPRREYAPTAPSLSRIQRTNILLDLGKVGHYGKSSLECFLTTQDDLFIIMNSLSSGACNFVTCFESDIVFPGCWCPSWPCRSESIPRNEFRQLKKLKLVLRGWEFVKPESGVQFRDLGLYLDNANALDHLVLHTSRPTLAQVKVSQPLDMLIGLEPTLPRLKVLDLRGFYTPRVSLQNFLQRYRHTLESLSLHHITLVPDGIEESKEHWPVLLDALTSQNWSSSRLRLWSLRCVTYTGITRIRGSFLAKYRIGRR